MHFNGYICAGPEREKETILLQCRAAEPCGATCGERSGEREERQRGRYGEIEESVALLRNAIRNSSFITSRHLHFIKILSLILFRFYYLSAETVFTLTTDGCNIYTSHTHKSQKNEKISPAEETQCLVAAVSKTSAQCDS